MRKQYTILSLFFVAHVAWSFSSIASVRRPLSLFSPSSSSFSSRLFVETTNGASPCYSDSDTSGVETVDLSADNATATLVVAEAAEGLSTPPMKLSKRQRLLEALPGGWFLKRFGKDTYMRDSNFTSQDSVQLDKVVLQTAIPSMINLAVVPLVNSVDTFWVGRLGIALALAGQAAANQAFFTVYFLVNYLPTITAPLVASAVGSGNTEQARDRVCESLFLSNVLGLIGTAVLIAFPVTSLSMVLERSAPAMAYAAPYLRVRALSMVPVLVSATGFAAFRGLLDTVTPLKVSLLSNVINLVLDPLMIFFTPLRVVGAALATALSELVSGVTYWRLLLQKKLIRWSQVLRPPSWASLAPLLQGGLAMLGRQLAINVALVAGSRRAQVLDPTGVAAAAYGIVMQLYSIGIVINVAMQGTASALVPSVLAQTNSKTQARRMADRIFIWGGMTGLLLGALQYGAAKTLAPVFSTVPAVQAAVQWPSVLAALLHVLDGPVFVAEGIMLGLGNYNSLVGVTTVGVGVMLAVLASPIGRSLAGVFYAQLAWTVVELVLVSAQYLRWGNLARRRKTNEPAGVTP